MVSAWLMDDSDADQRLPHQRVPNVPLSLEDMKKLGVLYWKIDPERWEEQVNQIKNERGYKCFDEITCSRARMPDYNDKLKMFYQEHIHEDEEIRYIKEGTGYFDVRNDSDEWVRILVEPNDLLILPAGIYHRFTPIDEHLVAMRLFQEAPKWTPINRPEGDNNPFRQEYLAKYVEPQKH